MHVLAIVALLGGAGYGFENDWKIAKGYKSYQECRAENRWWTEELDTWNGHSFIRPCADMTLQMTSDASKAGWVRLVQTTRHNVYGQSRKGRNT